MGSSATANSPTTSSCIDDLRVQLESMNIQRDQRQSSPIALHASTASPQTTTTAGGYLDRCRIVLYLSLIPQHLVPRHLFTIDPQTGHNIGKSTDRTVQLLHHLEELWDAADFCEDIVLEAVVRSVSLRQRRWGGEEELTAGDVQMAKEMVLAGGVWSPVRNPFVEGFLVIYHGIRFDV